jgi:hypothetical protein
MHYLETIYCEANTNFIKVVSIDKVLAMILYKLLFGHSDRAIGQQFARRRPTTETYNLIIFRVLTNKNCCSLDILAPSLGKGCIMSLDDFMVFLGFPTCVLQLMILISNFIKNLHNIMY